MPQGAIEDPGVSQKRKSQREVSLQSVFEWSKAKVLWVIPLRCLGRPPEVTSQESRVKSRESLVRVVRWNNPPQQANSARNQANRSLRKYDSRTGG